MASSMKLLDQRQNELKILLNEFKAMEQNRKDHNEESQAELQKQRSKIESLRKENEILKNELQSFVKLTTKQSLTATQQGIIKQIHEAGDKYTALITQESNNIMEYESQIEQGRKLLLQFQKKIGGSYVSKENDEMIKKQIRILENRLEKATSKYNDSIASNKALKLTIDDLKKQKSVYDQLRNKLQRELDEINMKTSTMIETSNQIYEERDAYLLEITAIETEDRKDKLQYEQQMNEINQLLETELKLNGAPINNNSTPNKLNDILDNVKDISPTTTTTLTNGLKRKSMKRLPGSRSTGALSMSNTKKIPTTLIDTSYLVIEDKPYNGNLGNTGGGILSQQPKRASSSSSTLRKSLNAVTITTTTTTNNNNKDSSSSNNNTSNSPSNTNNTAAVLRQSYIKMNESEHIQNFENAYERIRQATGITDINELVKKFLKTEQNNYSLFHYITEQIQEIEKINEKLQVLETEKYIYTSHVTDQKKQEMMLQKVTNDYEQSDMMIQKLRQKVNENMMIISDAYKLLQYIVTQLNTMSKQRKNSTSMSFSMGVLDTSTTLSAAEIVDSLTESMMNETLQQIETQLQVLYDTYPESYRLMIQQQYVDKNKSTNQVTIEESKALSGMMTNSMLGQTSTRPYRSKSFQVSQLQVLRHLPDSMEKEKYNTLSRIPAEEIKPVNKEDLKAKMYKSSNDIMKKNGTNNTGNTSDSSKNNYNSGNNSSNSSTKNNNHVIMNESANSSGSGSGGGGSHRTTDTSRMKRIQSLPGTLPKM